MDGPAAEQGTDVTHGGSPGRGGPWLRSLVGRLAVVACLVVGGLLVSAQLPDPGPARAADPVSAADPAPAPAPYGGALDAPDPGGSFDESQVLEVAMLALGSLNGLAFAAVVIVSRFRGSSAAETRRALMTRTARGVPSGPRPRRIGGTRHRNAV
ncbi:hypothetical protein [Actinomycetospora aeridis]|uniref:Uncharacterized protein n=1 Tax=Actinomycetospora aeridis TaxID=3129231 RepID=A0ABU8N5W9_9PSEU